MATKTLPNHQTTVISLENQAKVDQLLTAEPQMSAEDVVNKLKIGSVRTVSRLVRASHDSEYRAQLHATTEERIIANRQNQNCVRTRANLDRIAAESTVNLQTTNDSRDIADESMLSRKVPRLPRPCVCTLENQDKVDKLLAAEPSLTPQEVTDKLQIGAIGSVARLCRASRDAWYRKQMHRPKPHHPRDAICTLKNQKKVDQLLEAEPDLALKEVATKLNLGPIEAVARLCEASRDSEYREMVHKPKIQKVCTVSTPTNQARVDKLLAAEPDISIEEMGEKLNILSAPALERMCRANRDSQYRKKLHTPISQKAAAVNPDDEQHEEERVHANRRICTLANQAKVDALIAAEPDITIRGVVEKLQFGSTKSINSLVRASRDPEYRESLHAPMKYRNGKRYRSVPNQKPAKKRDALREGVDQKLEHSRPTVPPKIVVLAKLDPSEVLINSQRQQYVRFNFPSVLSQTACTITSTKHTTFYNCAQCGGKFVKKPRFHNCTEWSKKTAVKEETVSALEVKQEECESELSQNQKIAEKNVMMNDDIVKREPNWGE